MNRLRTLAIAVLFASPVMACAGDPSSEARPTVGQLGLSALNDGMPAALPITVNGGIVIESAKFWADEVMLVGDLGRSDDLAIEDRTLDLGAGMQLTFESVPPGLYSRVVIDLDAPDADEVGTNPGDVRASYVITGRTAAGTPFTIRDRAELNMDVRAGDGVDVRLGQMLDVIVRLDVGAWWTGVDFGAPADQDEIVIDSGPTLLRFQENLIRSASLLLAARTSSSSEP